MLFEKSNDVVIRNYQAQNNQNAGEQAQIVAVHSDDIAVASREKHQRAVNHRAEQNAKNLKRNPVRAQDEFAEHQRSKTRNHHSRSAAHVRESSVHCVQCARKSRHRVSHADSHATHKLYVHALACDHLRIGAERAHRKSEIRVIKKIEANANHEHRQNQKKQDGGIGRKIEGAAFYELSYV